MPIIEGATRPAHANRVRRPTNTTFSKLAALFVLGVMVGCSSSTTPDEERRTGLLSQSTNGLILLPLSIETPDSIARDSSFVVRITTYGTLHCARLGETETTSRNDTTVIVPFDYHLVYAPCAGMVDSFLHEVTLTADEIGPMVVEVQGLHSPAGWDNDLEPVVHHREVVVVVGS